MTSDNSSKIQGAIIAVIGTVIAGLVTAKLTKMLNERSLSTRADDLRRAMENSGLTASQIRAAASSWVSHAASHVADKASTVAAKTAPSVVEHKIDQVTRP